MQPPSELLSFWAFSEDLKWYFWYNFPYCLLNPVSVADRANFYLIAGVRMLQSLHLWHLKAQESLGIINSNWKLNNTWNIFWNHKFRNNTHKSRYTIPTLHNITGPIYALMCLILIIEQKQTFSRVSVCILIIRLFSSFQVF